MAGERYSSECWRCRELIQQARGILIWKRAFSGEEADRYIYELARAQKAFIVEVADHIVKGDWMGGLSGPSAADMDRWLGYW